MGMGYMAYSVDVIRWEDIAQLVPDEAKAMDAILEEHELTMDDLIRHLDGREPIDEFPDEWHDEHDIEDVTEDIERAYKRLKAAFTRATTVDSSHLELAPLYHDQEYAGSRYDDIDGGAWEVTGVWQYSPAGLKFKDAIHPVSFVVFG